MDLYCQVCGEPWDFFSVTDEFTVQESKDFKAGKGCPSCKGIKPERRPFRAEIMSMVSVLSGDDLDGAASDMDFAEDWFGDEFWEE